MGFFFLGLVSVLVFRRLLFVPVHALKRKARLKPATTAQFFLIASGRPVKIPRLC